MKYVIAFLRLLDLKLSAVSIERARERLDYLEYIG